MNLSTMPMTRRRLIFSLGVVLLALASIGFVSAVPARAQEPSASQPGQRNSAESNSAESKKDSGTAPNSFGEELVKEQRQVTGADKPKEEEEEENESLKHARPVRWLAEKVGWSVHGAHLFLFVLNFATIVIIVLWAGRKFLPAMFRNRSQAIQQALEEARAASQDANRRLADIENRLRQLDVEIGRMQATAEKEAAAEEGRIQSAAEEDMRKVVLAAENEIAAAVKQARRDLSTHTANLALALARQQIHVDSDTDQLLVRSFASKLASNNDGGKDGR
jgi:F-type H+-transporting ATPase subunit b